MMFLQTFSHEYFDSFDHYAACWLPLMLLQRESLFSISLRGGSFQSCVMLRLFWKVFPTRTPTRPTLDSDTYFYMVESLNAIYAPGNIVYSQDKTSHNPSTHN